MGETERADLKAQGRASIRSFEIGISDNATAMPIAQDPRNSAFANQDGVWGKRVRNTPALSHLDINL